MEIGSLSLVIRFEEQAVCPKRGSSLSARSVSRNTVDRRRIRDCVQVIQASCLQILAHSYFLVLIGKANGQMVARVLRQGEGF